ncbi:hypothetical protein MX582_003562 [Salmonella enterica]|nr:hypothetical protein [Salmonella enterica]EEU4856202.1 hypothetical protein [Salmonella enterica]EEU4861784.1 hypothetical protein [Salmonella enterica]EEU4870865.1 hypothetical protein [Salmonella enterica]EEU4886888.1 hypothetical protein [Salmonella enterica]
MNPVDFIRKNIAAQLAAEGFSEQVALGGGLNMALIITGAALRPAGRGACLLIVFSGLASGHLGRQLRRSVKRARKKPRERG